MGIDRVLLSERHWGLFGVARLLWTDLGRVAESAAVQDTPALEIRLGAGCVGVEEGKGLGGHCLRQLFFHAINIRIIYVLFIVSVLIRRTI